MFSRDPPRARIPQYVRIANKDEVNYYCVATIGDRKTTVARTQRNYVYRLPGIVDATRDDRDGVRSKAMCARARARICTRSPAPNVQHPRPAFFLLLFFHRRPIACRAGVSSVSRYDPTPTAARLPLTGTTTGRSVPTVILIVIVILQYCTKAGSDDRTISLQIIILFFNVFNRLFRYY